MKAAIFRGPGDVEVGDRPDPVIQAPTDAIVRVVLACVCGSDLWYYRGESPHAVGSIGHEFIGVVEETGSDVDTVAVGDLVVAPVHLQRHVLPALPERLDDQLRAGRELRQRHDRRRPGRGRAGPPRRRHPRPGSRLRARRRHAAQRCSPCPTSCRPAITQRSAPASARATRSLSSVTAPSACPRCSPRTGWAPNASSP